jgi:mono/diheme cytochrome c family protein
MKLSMIRCASLAALCTVTALAGAAEGAAVFAAKCQNCHGPNGEGKDAIAKMMKVTIHPLASKEVQDKSDADMKKIITTGQGKMKAVSGLSDAQVTDLIAHVRALKK